MCYRRLRQTRRILARDAKPAIDLPAYRNELKRLFEQIDFVRKTGPIAARRPKPISDRSIVFERTQVLLARSNPVGRDLLSVSDRALMAPYSSLHPDHRTA